MKDKGFASKMIRFNQLLFEKIEQKFAFLADQFQLISTDNISKIIYRYYSFLLT